MKLLASSFVFLILVTAIVMFESAYHVDNKNHAVITQFGKTVQFTKDAGWHFKIPFLQRVHHVPTKEILKEDLQHLSKEDNIKPGFQHRKRDAIEKNKSDKIVQIKSVDVSELKCPTRIIEGIEQVMLQPGMSNMQYNLCNQKIRRKNNR